VVCYALTQPVWGRNKLARNKMVTARTRVSDNPGVTALRSRRFRFNADCTPTSNTVIEQREE